MSNFNVGDYVLLVKPVMFPCGTTKNKELAKIIRQCELEVDLQFKGDMKIYESWIGDIRHPELEELADMLKEAKADAEG